MDNTKEILKKKKKVRHCYSVRYPGDPSWHPQDHIGYIRLNKTESIMIDELAGKPVVIESSREEIEEIELRRYNRGLPFVDATSSMPPDWKPKWTRHVVERGSPPLIKFEDGEEKHLSFVRIVGMIHSADPSIDYNTWFHCYDMTMGLSDEIKEWRIEQGEIVTSQLYYWFEKEHFDLSVIRHGRRYLIKPIYKYYKPVTDFWNGLK